MFADCGRSDPAPVGSFPEGTSIMSWGLLDLSGNVKEWMADGFDEDLYQRLVALCLEQLHDPLSPRDLYPANPPPALETLPVRRTVKGGGYRSSSRELGTANRESRAPNDDAPDVGFRCAYPGRVEDALHYPLSVSAVGAGKVRITPRCPTCPAPVDCSGDCSMMLPIGTRVEITPLPDGPSNILFDEDPFDDCADQTVLMYGDRRCRVSFVDAGPTACFTFTPAMAEPNQAVTLDATCSRGAIVRWSWNFLADLGDNPEYWTVGTSSMQHVFREGTQRVGLRVTDASGATDDFVSLVEVAGPVPCFAVTSTTPAAGSAITFDASCTGHLGTGSNTTFEWDFSGTNAQWVSLGPTTEYTYPTPGRRAPALRVTDSEGRVARTSARLEVR